MPDDAVDAWIKAHGGASAVVDTPVEASKPKDSVDAWLAANGPDSPLDTEQKRSILDVAKVPHSSINSIPGEHFADAMKRDAAARQDPAKYDEQAVSEAFDRHFPKIRTKADAAHVAQQLYVSRVGSRTADETKADLDREIAAKMPWLERAGFNAAATVAEFAKGATGQYLGTKGPISDRLAQMESGLESADPWTKHLHGTANFAGAALPIGTMSKAVGSVPAMAAYGYASTPGSLISGERAGGAGKAAAFAWLAGRLTGAALDKFEALPDSMKTAFTEKAAKMVANGGSFAAVDAVFHGPDAARAIENFALGAGTEAVGGESMSKIKGRYADRASETGAKDYMAGLQREGWPALPQYASQDSRISDRTGSEPGTPGVNYSNEAPSGSIKGPEATGGRFPALPEGSTPLVPAPSTWTPGMMEQTRREGGFGPVTGPGESPRVGLGTGRIPKGLPEGRNVLERTLVHDFTPPGGEPIIPPESGTPYGQRVLVPEAPGTQKRLPADAGGPLAPPPEFPDVRRPGDMPMDVARRAGVRAPGYGETVIDVDFVKPSRGTGLGGPGAGERGALGVSYEDLVNLGKKALEKSGARSTWEGLVGTGFFALNRESPKMGAYAAKADAAKEWGAGKGVVLGSEVRRNADTGIWPYEGSKAERFDAAKNEEDLRSKGASFFDMEGVKGNKYGAKKFKQLFPNEQAFKATVDSPEYRKFVAEHMKVFEGKVQQMNQFATGQELPDIARGVYTGVRSNLVPLTAEKGGISTVGPKIRKSTVGREATMRADDYDFRSDVQFGNAAAQAQKIHALRMMFGAGVKDGTAIPYKNGMKSAPDGYSAFNVRADNGLAIPTPEGGMVEGETVYLKDSVVPEVRRMFGLDRLAKPTGILSKIGGLATKVQMIAPVDKIFHSLNLSGVAYRLGGWNPKAIPDAWREMGDQEAAAEETMRQAKWGGSKPKYAEPKTKIGEFLHKYSVDLDRIDLSVRKVVLDNVEAKIAKGDLPDTPKTRRDALLQAGNYHQMSMDNVTHAMRTLGLQPFAVASKTMMANALRSGPLGGFSSGLEADTMGKAVKLRAVVVAKWAAYLGAVGAWNYARTGEFSPAGVGVAVLGKDKDGNWIATDLPGAATGFSRMYRTGGAKAIVEGRGLKGAATDIADSYVRAHLGGPATEAAAEVFGYRVGVPPYAHGGGGPLRAAKHLNAYASLISGLIDGDDMGDIGHEAFGPMIPRKVPAK